MQPDMEKPVEFTTDPILREKEERMISKEV